MLNEGCAAEVIWPQRHIKDDFMTGLGCKGHVPLGPEHGVTLVTIASIDRIAQVMSVAMHWEGPISIALHAGSDEETEQVKDLVHGRMGAWLEARLHAVKVVLVSACFQDARHMKQYVFPINVLRNHAVVCAHTESVFYVDVDFIPSHGAARLIQEAMKEIDLNSEVLVIPCFIQADLDKALWPYPVNIWVDNELLVSGDPVRNFDVLQEVAKGSIVVPGSHHGSTDYLKWIQLSSSMHDSAVPAYAAYRVSYRCYAFQVYNE